MKKSNVFLISVIFAVVFAFSSCETTKVSTDVAAEDINGYWSQKDVNEISKAMIDEVILSPRVAKFEVANARVPVVIVGKISNKSRENIDTSLLAKSFQTAIINSGVLEFVADAGQRTQLREEKADQADYAYDTAKSIGNEQAADFMLQGSVSTLVQTEGKNSVRSYTVDMQLIDIESNRIIWQGMEIGRAHV